MPERVTSLERPAEQFNEEMLIRRVLAGEHDLFYELIRPYERRVYAAAFAILRNDADAEDVAQEAVLKAFKHIRQFRAESRFSTWLIQITVNEARMRRRKEHANIMEPIADRQDEEGNYTPRDFADWREVPSGKPGNREGPPKTRDALAQVRAKLPEGVFLLHMQQHH